MSKVIIGMSMSLDGIASGTSEADFWDVHNAVLGWLFDLQSWRSAAGMDGGEDNADSRLWAEEYERIGAQVAACSTSATSRGVRLRRFGHRSSC